MGKTLDFNTDDESLREILSNGKQYFVPKFQRDYSWSHEQWEDLWDDIKLVISGEEKYHYMGYLVIQPSDNEDGEQKASKIIDGQQRLTTFSLIILAAVKRLKEIGDEEEREKNLLTNFIGSADLVSLKIENKLRLNRNNDYYYREAVKGEELRWWGKKHTVRLMQQAMEYFHKQFKPITTGEEISKVINIISERLLFTTIYIGSDLNAYKVFETLNARGVQLSSSDLLKNYIFSLIDRDADTPEDVLDELDIKWGMIGDDIGDKNYTDYVLAEWNSRHLLARKTELFKNIKRAVANKNVAYDYLNILKRNSAVYAAMLTPEDEFWKDHPDQGTIRKNLKFLKLFNIRQPISVLLAVFVNMPNKFVRILNWIRIFSLRYNVIGRQHTGEQESMYNRLCVMINEKCTINEIKDEILKLYPNDKEFKHAFSDKTMPTEQSNRKAKYLLARLAEYKTNIAIDETDLTVEHILPANPEKAWRDYFGNNWDMFNQRLGNMALVNKKENKKLGHRSFCEKKQILSASAYKINKEVDAYDEWNSDAVESRQQKMADIAVKVWKI